MVELQQTADGAMELVVDKWDVFVNLLGVGFTIAIVVVVLAAAVKIGWRLAPWILAAGFLAFMFL